MFEGTKREQLKPPSEEWYQFASRIELETDGDAGAGYTAEQFLPSFWSKETDRQSNRSFRTSAKDSSTGFTWFLAGLGFGALLGVLYAPRSGRDTREAIHNSAQEGKDFIRTHGREARDAVGQWVERGKEVVNRQKEQLSSAIEAGRQPYQEASGAEGTKKS